MKKTWIRVLVFGAIFAWPAVLSYQLWEAHQQLAASSKLEQKVSVRLADARAKATTQVAHREAQ
jgi:hypothetical protein